MLITTCPKCHKDNKTAGGSFVSTLVGSDKEKSVQIYCGWCGENYTITQENTKPDPGLDDPNPFRNLSQNQL